MEPTNILNSQYELFTLLEEHFANGIPDFATLIAYNQKGESKGKLLDHRNKGKGLEAIKKAIETAISINTNYIDLFLFSSERTPFSRPAMSFRVYLNNPINEEKQTDDISSRFKTPEYLTQQFNGLGGLNELIDAKTKIAELSFDVQKYKYENEKLREQLAEATNEARELDKENDELNNLNNQLIEKTKELEKYVPGNTKVMGLDPTALFGAVAERALIGVVKKAPGTAKSILGLSDEQYKNFLGELDESEKEEAKPIDNKTTDVEFETTEELSEEQKIKKQYSDGVAKWIYALNNDDIKKVGILLEYFREDFNKIDDLLDFINQQKK